MAFDIISQPVKIQPVYNNLTFKVFYTDYNKPKFKYIFYVYYDNVLVNTTKLYPRPDGTCIFDPSKILQQYISYTFDNSITTLNFGYTSEIIKYRVKMSYEYYNGSAIVEYVGNVGEDKITWNGVFDWHSAQDVPTNVLNYLPYWDRPSRALNYVYNGNNKIIHRELDINSKRTISFFIKDENNEHISKFVDVYIKCRDGKYKHFIFDIPITASNPQFNIIHFPIGISQLNSIDNWSYTLIPPGKSEFINITEDSYLYIELKNENFDESSATYYFKLVDEYSSKYDKYTIAYQSPFGGFGYVDFNLKHQRTLTNEKIIYDRIIPYNYNSTDRSTTVYGNLSNETITLNTNWIMHQDLITEIKYMMESPTLFLIEEKTNKITPVFIEKASFEERQLKQDKMISYTFTFSQAFRNNTIN